MLGWVFVSHMLALFVLWYYFPNAFSLMSIMVCNCLLCSMFVICDVFFTSYRMRFALNIYAHKQATMSVQ